MPAASAPSHLSLFIADPASGQPVSHLPVFAEIAVPRVITPPAPDPRFEELIGATLYDADPTVDDDADLYKRVLADAGQALVESLHRQSWAILLNDVALATSFFGTVFKRTLQEGGWSHFSEIDPAALKGEFSRVFREEAVGHGWLILPPAEETEALWSEPLGVLATDHVGYLSFDLNRLRPEVRTALVDAIDARRNDPNAKSKIAIWVHPYGYDKPQDALAQARFASDAIVARFLVRPQVLPTRLANMGLRSLQNPALIDWFLSPASFASNPRALTGEDGCEQLLPASLALAEFGIRQVVRILDPQDDFQVPPGHRAAYVDEYKVSWYALGHSLGEIKYSLPLAPGESVKLAVVDWSWDSLTKRDEKTKLTEDILHQTHRDRTITETVVAGVKEVQHGSSFMAGGALSAGVGAKLGPIGAAAGGSFAMGGSTATSDGSRDLAAENVQKLMDSFSQASSSQREINSTVVIQARQEEKESVQTRTFTNYNHSHTLTILYYEVLRHYRVTVEWVRRRRAVLLKLPALVTSFDAATLIANRSVLEPALLDQSLKPAFDALEKRESLSAFQTAQGIVPKPAQGQWWEGDAEFDMFEIGIWSKDKSPDKIVTYVVTADQLPKEKRFELHYIYKGEHFDDVYDMNSGDRFNDDWEQWTLARIWDHVQLKYVSVKWKDIVGFQFEKWGTGAPWRIDFITINAFSKGGFRMGLTEWHVDVDLYFAAREPAVQTFTRIKLPGWPPPPPIPAVPTPEQDLKQDELYLVKKLEKHIDLNKDYYSQVLMLAVDPATIAMQFEKTKWDPAGTTMVGDHVDPYPLEVFGSYIAYPLAKQPQINDALVADIYAAIQSGDPARQQWALDQLATLSKGELRQVTERLTLLASKSQRLITLPTRGVFAEGKLGHCNVSEEIDNTRFWKWDEHPIPVTAPEIAPVNVVQPTPQQTEGTTPTGFPQSLVNIVNPSPAPDPHGLTAALTLLGTANIFRDMSGQAQVADLLKKLSDNSVKVAEISSQLAGVKPPGGGGSSGPGSSGYGGSSAGGAGSTGAQSSGGATGTRTPPPSPSEQHDRIQVVRNAVAKGNITPEEGNRHIGNILAFGIPADAAGASGVARLIVTGNSVAARAFFPLKVTNGETMFIIGSEGLPESAIEQIFAVPANPVGAGGSVILSPVGPGLVRLLAARAGVAGLMAQLPDYFHVKPEHVLYSVPLFVEIAASQQALDTIFNNWNLSDARAGIVVEVREILRSIQGANVRFVQTGFAGSSNPTAQVSLPPQYQLNGAAREHLTIVTLDHTSPSSNLIDMPHQGSEAEPLIGGMAWINLKWASEGQAPFNEAFKALLAKLAANPADAALRTFLTTFVTRFLASVILRTTTHMVFGINPGTPSIQECTGFELAQGADAGDPASYTDRGLEAMRPRAVAAKLLRETFPLPPDFS